MDPMQLVLKHFEKGVLALFFAWLAMTVVGLASEPSGLQEAAAVETYLTAVEKHMGEASTKPPKAPTWEADLKRQLDPGSVPAAVAFPGWVMHRRPAFLHQVEVEVPEYHAAHHPPTADAAAVDRGKIKVTWEPSQENLYVVTSFQVHRRAGEDGTWEKVKELEASEREWTDDGINSRLKYFYKVVSVAKIDAQDPVVTQYNLTLANEEAEKESGVVGPIAIKQDLIILPTNVHVVTDEELIADKNAKSYATIKLKKWDPEGNTWDEKTYFQKPVGWKIGQKEKIKRRDVDFTTGAELIDVEVRTRQAKSGTFEERVHVIKVRWPDGKEEEFTSKDEEDAKAAEEGDKKE